MSAIMTLAKSAVERGTDPGFSRAIYHAEIGKRAAAIRKADPKLSEAQAFTKAITDDPEGRILFKASRRADGPEIERDAKQDDVKKPAKAPVGPAGQKMQALADHCLAANPALTPAAAYARVFTHPSNADLRAAVLREQLDPRRALADADDAQRQSDATARRNAGSYPGNSGDIVGPKPSAALKRDFDGFVEMLLEKAGKSPLGDALALQRIAKAISREFA